MSWLRACLHSRMGMLQRRVAFISDRKRIFLAASSLGKLPLVLIERLSTLLTLSMVG